MSASATMEAATGRPGVVARLAAILSAIRARRIRDRRTDLRTLDDRQLRDIGLMRVAAGPFQERLLRF